VFCIALGGGVASARPVAGAGVTPAAVAHAAAAPFTASSVTAPPNDAELFYNGDTGSGSVAVQGTVSPGVSSTTGDLLCYSGPQTYIVAKAIPVSSGSFTHDVSLAPVSGAV
jgi:hypothetical protein